MPTTVVTSYVTRCDYLRTVTIMTAIRSNHGCAEIDPKTETAVVSHDWGSDTSLATTIVSTVADLSETDPVEVDRLYDRVDPDGLETIFRPADGSTTRNEGRVSFRLEGYSITVHASGTIVVTRTG